jgi:multiple sugar transport system permease protein
LLTRLQILIMLLLEYLLYPGEYSFPWETISTATFLAIIPVLIITALFQKQIIGGLTAGSDK